MWFLDNKIKHYLKNVSVLEKKIASFKANSRQWQVSQVWQEQLSQMRKKIAEAIIAFEKETDGFQQTLLSFLPGRHEYVLRCSLSQRLHDFFCFSCKIEDGIKNVQAKQKNEINLYRFKEASLNPKPLPIDVHKGNVNFPVLTNHAALNSEPKEYAIKKQDKSNSAWTWFGFWSTHAKKEKQRSIRDHLRLSENPNYLGKRG